jgi:exodeoxyribonuclease VII small subunit
MAKTETLEQSFEKLDKIIKKMEEENPTLDESFKLYNDGINLVKNCTKQLDKVEKQIVILNNGEEA